MPRTTWQDLAGEDPRHDAADAGDQARRELEAARTRGTTDLPRGLEEIPELGRLLEERRRLERTLEQLTGQGPSNGRDEREARRFPIPSSSDREGSGLSPRKEDSERERERLEERRAMQLETIDQRRAQRREDAARLNATERAARRRRAGEERVARAEQAWQRHRDNLIQARDTLRDLARSGGGLSLPGADALDRAADRIQSASTGIDRLAGALRGITGADAPRGGSSGRERSTDGSSLGRFRDLARDARRLEQDPLRDTSAGERLRALRQELAPPELRPLPGEREDDTVDHLEARRQRALEALRERRSADTSRESRTTRPAERSSD